jgi:hypothetical protein
MYCYRPKPVGKPALRTRFAVEVAMGSDERAIRELHTTWIEAVNAGDLAVSGSRYSCRALSIISLLSHGSCATVSGWIIAFAVERSGVPFSRLWYSYSPP